MAAKKELNYNKAYEELTTIVSEIENNNLPLDILAEKIKYAGQLIQSDEEKLNHALGLYPYLSKIEHNPIKFKILIRPDLIQIIFKFIGRLCRSNN